MGATTEALVTEELWFLRLAAADAAADAACTSASGVLPIDEALEGEEDAEKEAAARAAAPRAEVENDVLVSFCVACTRAFCAALSSYVE